MELCSLHAIYLGSNYGGSNEDNGNLLEKVPCTYCCTQCPQPCSRPPPTHDSIGDTCTLLESGSVSCGVTAPFSWILVCTRFCCDLQESISQSCVSSGGSMVGLMATSSKRAYVIPRSAAPEPLPLEQSTADLHRHRRCSNTVVSVSVGSLGPGAHKVCLSPLSISSGNGV